jgi:c-di-GMP-binding flagellar brake protein YcgR
MVSAHNQLIHVQAENSGHSLVTSILQVDDSNGVVIIDNAPGETMLTSETLHGNEPFLCQTVLDNVRMLFSASNVERCDYDSRPALRIGLPASLVRLQRRNSYRVQIPIGAPIKCTIPLRDKTGKPNASATLTLANIGAGGVGAIDHEKLIPARPGTNFTNCRIDLPDGPVTMTLQLRDSQEVIIGDGKNVSRLGFMFVDPPASFITLAQRFIMKLEREQNARKAGTN